MIGQDEVRYEYSPRDLQFKYSIFFYAPRYYLKLFVNLVEKLYSSNNTVMQHLYNAYVRARELSVKLPREVEFRFVYGAVVHHLFYLATSSDMAPLHNTSLLQPVIKQLNTDEVHCTFNYVSISRKLAASILNFVGTVLAKITRGLKTDGCITLISLYNPHDYAVSLLCLDEGIFIDLYPSFEQVVKMNVHIAISRNILHPSPRVLTELLEHYNEHIGIFKFTVSIYRDIIEDCELTSKIRRWLKLLGLEIPARKLAEEYL